MPLKSQIPQMVLFQIGEGKESTSNQSIGKRLPEQSV